MKLRVFVVTTCAFICLCSSAQNVSPSISDPDRLELIKEKQQVVFEQLFEDPTNLSLLFEYANLSILVGDLEAAIGVFDQMLVYDPELPRIRLELGVLYYRLGAYALAKTYLESVGKFDPPLEVQAHVDDLLKSIETANEIYAWRQILTFGLKHTSNGNSGINADFIEIGDFLLEVDPESKREGSRSSLYNYSLSVDQDLNHPRGDNIQYFFSYGADRLKAFSQFDVQSNVFSARRNFNLDENYFSFFNLEDPVFTPNINLLRVVLNREEVLRSGRISLDYSGQLDDGSSMLFSYYRDEKNFKSGAQKNGRVNGISFGQSYVWPGSEALYGYKIILENYRANADYEFYENYGVELSYSQPLKENWQFSSKYSYQDKSHDKEYPLFGARHDQAETLRLNLIRPIGACWSLNFGWVFTETRSTINIYKRSANNLSAQVNYQCFK
ncbi:tetratricopeptide repeat protein [Gammaproteobacteria bacterium]|nr:tetratricopeptide repeat protein [Gammaproteobacteria bacterium]MDC1110952.1 tetratricopeptide repeat protein [Gammaproteobacteria bacterium]MDC1132133.1 tetratricopeptide repeat protein [Gammaproteobacteria bacterium]